VTVSEAEVREAARAPSPEAQREEEAERIRAKIPAGAAWTIGPIDVTHG
jgi:hypothetical protein